MRVNIPKLVARAIIQLIPIALAVWLSWRLTPLGGSNPPERIVVAVRTLSVVMALTAIVLLVPYLQWLRRLALIFRLRKLVRASGKNGVFHFLAPDGTSCSVSEHPDGVLVLLGGGGLSTLAYEISPDTMFSIYRDRDLWLDETNSEFGPALRWLEVENTSFHAVNERKVAQKIFKIIKDQPRG